MIIHQGKNILSDYEKAEIREAIMMVTEKLRLDECTIMNIPCENVCIMWGKDEIFYPEDQLCITGKTADVVSQIFRIEGWYHVTISEFLEKYYPELYKQLKKE